MMTRPPKFKPSLFTLWLITVALVFALAVAMLVDRARDDREHERTRQRECERSLVARDQFEDIDARTWSYVAELVEAPPEVTRGLLDFIHDRYAELEPPASCI